MPVCATRRAGCVGWRRRSERGSDAVVLDRRLRRVSWRAPDVAVGEIAAMREAALRLGRDLVAVGDVFRLGRVPECPPGIVRARHTANDVA
ncbi:MAG: hypothetical protein JO262_00960 [Solirubrobacterales bacterium]|nr:hypothetical protein [Solirubrobacterales bacterium]